MEASQAQPGLTFESTPTKYKASSTPAQFLGGMDLWRKNREDHDVFYGYVTGLAIFALKICLQICAVQRFQIKNR